MTTITNGAAARHRGTRWWQAPDLIVGLYLTGLTGFAVRFLWSSLFRTWFFSSDEYLVIGEVIRFAHGDVHQHFVDMPGTPFMAIGAMGWRTVYEVQHALGLTDTSGGLIQFTYRHLPALFTFIRAETLLFYALSIVLLFWTTALLVNRAAACVASLMLAASPPYASYSTFIRVESLAMCLMLLAILCLLYRERLPSLRSGLSEGAQAGGILFLAGVFAGLAAATRLHSITATVPVIALYLMLTPQNRSSGSLWWLKAAALATAAALAAGTWLVFVRWGPELASLPHARQMLTKMIVGGSAALAVAGVLYSTSWTRRILVRIVSPELVLVMAGCAAGLLVGMPTVVRHPGPLLHSMEMYNGLYVDWARAGLPLWQNVQTYLLTYFRAVVTGPPWGLLLALGAALILVCRDRRLIPFLAGAVLFFVSKPLNLVAAPHHVILWIPFYAIVASYPVGLLYRRLSTYPRAALSVVALGCAWLGVAGIFGPALVPDNTALVERRLDSVLQATAWIKQNTEPGATVAIAYYCFNPDIFYSYMRWLEVPVPESMSDGRNYIVWWGHASALKDTAGYACVTHADIPGIKAQLDATAPGEATDPFTDVRFRPLKSFGLAADEVTVFHFDYRTSAARP